MNRVKIEVFFTEPASPGDVSLCKLLKEVEEEYRDQVEIVTQKGLSKLYRDYALTATPAIIVGELVKIVGFCPSKETLISALREAGMGPE